MEIDIKGQNVVDIDSDSSPQINMKVGHNLNHNIEDYLGAKEGSSPAIHVEVSLKKSVTASKSNIENAVKMLLASQGERLIEDGELQFHRDALLNSSCEYVKIVDTRKLTQEYNKVLHFNDVKPICHIFTLNEETEGAEERDESDDYAVYFQWILPNSKFDGLWESLVYEEDIKDYLIDYVSTAITFSDFNVDQNLVSWNRLVLLHGPPGTGKTSLCKALANKMAINFASRYECGMLIEVNAHSLFSKWFSESGKLVMKLFDYIYELIEDTNMLVIVLIDEIESLSAARQKALSGSEPADSIRVVNALLTQIDKLKTKTNVLVMTTSNITEAIDDAMIDRADLKVLIPLPGPTAVYSILKSSLEELMRVGIIAPKRQLLNYQACYLLRDVENETTKYSNALRRIATECKGFSGRSIRKLTFLAYSRFLSRGSRVVDLNDFFIALSKTVVAETLARVNMEEK